MWVKICANTNLVDALHALELGADAVGFVFAPSKRQVTVAQVKAITGQLPPGTERVGVFLMDDIPAIAASAREAGLTTIQMHGGLDFEASARLRALVGPAISLIHVVHWAIGADETSAHTVRSQLQSLSQARLNERVLIDASVANASGGLGKTYDWAQAQAVLAEFPQLRFIIAGGLQPENVATAIATFHPYGVDVASGVEQTAGTKDPKKLAAFIENARRA